MELALISGFYSVKQMRVFVSPWMGHCNPLQVSSQQTLVLIYSTYPRRMESWVGLGRKEGCTNIRISAKSGIEPGTLWLEGRDLTNCTNHAHPYHVKRFNFYFLLKLPGTAHLQPKDDRVWKVGCTVLLQYFAVRKRNRVFFKRYNINYK